MLAPLQPDLIISGGFPWRIPADVLALPGSARSISTTRLLPRHRGPNATGWAFRRATPRRAMTIHRLTPEFDTGPILAQARIPITDDDDMATIRSPISWPRCPDSCAGAGAGARGEAGEAQDESRSDRGRPVRGGMADDRLDAAGPDRSQPGAQLGRVARHPRWGRSARSTARPADHQDPPGTGRTEHAGASTTRHGPAAGRRASGRAMWRRTNRDSRLVPHLTACR